MTAAIAYKIFFDKLNKHLLSVECVIQRPNVDGQLVSIPSWVPGSYLIRDFAKNIVAIEASSNNEKVFMQKINKNTWQCAPCNGPLIIYYSVFCFDQAARGAYVDHTRVFFDSCRIFLVIEGEEEQTHTVEILQPDSTALAKWRCATSMTPASIDNLGFGLYVANNHLELIDHPFEISDFQNFEFMVGNTPHSLIVAGIASADFPSLVSTVQKICTAQMNFFGELPSMQRYVFILSVLYKGWGGIEHRSSSSLICTRDSLPRYGEEIKREDYKSLLGLFSHEYFHLWNVKRIKPEVFINPNLNIEQYTRQLWIFEGITSYYDNLILVSAGVLTLQEYVHILQADINSMLQIPGINIQTLEESSFDAWIKFYQPDENSVNSSISYYLKGSLVALALDLLIIKNSKRKQSLADIMLVLWQQYGKTGLGLPEQYFEQVTFEVTGENYTEFFNKYLRTTASLELNDLLQDVGIIYKSKNPNILDNLGMKLFTDQNKLTVRSVLNNSVAENAGLSPNDVIIALNNLVVNISNIEFTIANCKINDYVTLHVIRGDILLELAMLNPPVLKLACTLEVVEDLTEAQRLSRLKWLGE